MRAEAARALSAPPAPADPGSPRRRKIRALRLRTPGRWTQDYPSTFAKRHAVAFLRPRESVCKVGSATGEFFPKANYGVSPVIPHVAGARSCPATPPRSHQIQARHYEDHAHARRRLRGRPLRARSIGTVDGLKKCFEI
jgi:hypothetical protein